MGLLHRVHSRIIKTQELRTMVLMGIVMNMAGRIINGMAYIQLIASEAFEEILYRTVGHLLRNLLPARAEGNRGHSRLQPKTKAIDKQGILVPR
jgi:hypothetical protein